MKSAWDKSSTITTIVITLLGLGGFAAITAWRPSFVISVSGGVLCLFPFAGWFLVKIGIAWARSVGPRIKMSDLKLDGSVYYVLVTNDGDLPAIPRVHD